jgi:hypothetical protein
VEILCLLFSILGPNAIALQAFPVSTFSEELFYHWYFVPKVWQNTEQLFSEIVQQAALMEL